MDLIVAKENEISDQLDSAIRKILIACCPHHTDEFSRGRTLNDHVTVLTSVLQDGDITTAHAAIVDKTILAGSTKLHVAGVANVCVLPEYRGSRLGHRVLTAAMEKAGTMDFDISMLFCTPELKKIYARAGFIEITDRNFACIENGTQTHLPPEKIRMYFPLGMPKFPDGPVDLLGCRW